MKIIRKLPLYKKIDTVSFIFYVFVLSTIWSDNCHSSTTVTYTWIWCGRLLTYTSVIGQYKLMESSCCGHRPVTARILQHFCWHFEEAWRLSWDVLAICQWTM